LEKFFIAGSFLGLLPARISSAGKLNNELKSFFLEVPENRKKERKSWDVRKIIIPSQQKSKNFVVIRNKLFLFETTFIFLGA
jgi:hypothetical protein